MNFDFDLYFDIVSINMKIIQKIIEKCKNKRIEPKKKIEEVIEHLLIYFALS